MKKYILFGSGVRASRILGLLNSNRDISYIIDNDKDKQNKNIVINGNTYRVLPPDILNSEDLDSVEVIIGSVRTDEMLEQLEAISVGNSKWHSIKYFEIFDEFYLKVFIVSFSDLHAPHIGYDFSFFDTDCIIFKISNSPCAIEFDNLFINKLRSNDYASILKTNGILTKDGIQFPCRNPNIYIEERGNIEYITLDFHFIKSDYKAAYEFAGTFIKNLSDVSYNRNPEFVPEDDFEPVVFKPGDVKPIAYYLPQFHQIPQNSEWWGKGFTEWTNVTKTYPLFQGHYQPHLPIDVGFYDLSNIEIQKRQINLAKKYGIYGFCYYYYHYESGKILDMPITRHLKNKELDFPFCICWANEDWTRGWLGNGSDILMKTSSNYSHLQKVIEDICTFMRDPRYIRVDRKPIVIVYRYANINNSIEFSRLWRDCCKKEGVGEIMLLTLPNLAFLINPLEFGYDGFVEFLPNIGDKKADVSYKHSFYSGNFKARIIDYVHFVESKLYNYDYSCLVYKNAFPNWDNSARYQNRAMIFHGSTPDLYKRFLSDIIRQAKQDQDSLDKYVFINAWNEWAEGAHLEPDRKYGYAYLKATREAIDEDLSVV